MSRFVQVTLLRLAEAADAARPPEPLGPAPQDPLRAMAHRLKTREGRALVAVRKSTVEPVIGIIKSVMKYSLSARR